MGSRPNQFEQAILERFAAKNPLLLPVIAQLRVDHREYSGAGSFTHFKPHFPVAIPDGYLSLDALITMPGVEHGMGGVLAMVSGQPDYLELFTYGSADWSGDFNGFAIDDGA